MRKEKISITLSKQVLKNIDMKAFQYGISRSSMIEMRLRRKKR